MSQNYQNIIDLGGLITDAPEDKIPLRNASDIANIDMSVRGLIQTRKGYGLFGESITEAGENTRAYIFKKNFGEILRVLLRIRDNGTNSYLVYYNPNLQKWETAWGGLTTGAVMGFTPFNNSNLNALVMCNGVNNYAIWDGAIRYFASATTNTIVCSGTPTLAFDGMTATGKVILEGTEYTYTGLSNQTFTGVTPDPTLITHTVGAGVSQSVVEYASVDKGNILMTASARIHMAGFTDKPSTLLSSKSGDATVWTVGTNPGDPNLEDFPEGGGPITALDSQEGGRWIIHKQDAILQFILEVTTTYKLGKKTTISMADDVGATNIKALSAFDLTTFYMSGIAGLKQMLVNLTYDKIVVEGATDVIQPTIDNYDFSSSAVAYYPPKKLLLCTATDENGDIKLISLYARKSITDSTRLVYDISIDDNIPAADFIVDRKDLYFVSALDQNCYKMFDQKSDNGVGINHRWTSGSITLGEPAKGKEFNILYVEGLIADRAKIKVSILYGQMGSETSKEYIIRWDDSKHVANEKISALGVEALGISSLGASSSDINDSRPFSFPIHFNVNKSTRFKVRVETVYDDETVPDVYWAISNIAFNPTLLDIDNNKIANSNV